MIKGTPFAGAPDDLKLRFVDESGGQFVSDFMQLEQRLLGDWKVGKIVEAAGEGFDSAAARQDMRALVGSRPVVCFSFVDCPWCLAAKRLLFDELALSDEQCLVLELEDLGRRGKSLRAAIALGTGRTSLPAVFVGGRSLGGFTDGFDRVDEVRAPVGRVRFARGSHCIVGAACLRRPPSWARLSSASMVRRACGTCMHVASSCR
uniref:Glutaredoxin domain-containing protein n=1 Tax=Prymnesium polylepis TaxID=72548 RepID=A0A7S4M2M1_9EUKA